MCAEIHTKSELLCYSMFCMVSDFIVYISFFYLSLDFKALLVGGLEMSSRRQHGPFGLDSDQSAGGPY
jgi:hypothetical protein